MCVEISEDLGERDQRGRDEIPHSISRARERRCHRWSPCSPFCFAGVKPQYRRLTGHPPTEPAWVCRAALPKSAHPGAKKALTQIWDAEDKPHALAAVKAFSAAYGAKFPKAAAKITAWPRSLSIRASS